MFRKKTIFLTQKGNEMIITTKTEAGISESENYFYSMFVLRNNAFIDLGSF